jgi:hypothetical protein
VRAIRTAAALEPAAFDRAADLLQREIADGSNAPDSLAAPAEQHAMTAESTHPQVLTITLVGAEHDPVVDGDLAVRGGGFASVAVLSCTRFRGVPEARHMILARRRTTSSASTT